MTKPVIEYSGLAILITLEGRPRLTPVDSSNSNDIFSDVFDAAVLVLWAGEWSYLDKATDALAFIARHFADQDAPSCQRAVSACRACVSGEGNAIAARATFVVAVMEAGLQFEIIEDPSLALERKAELEAEAAVTSALFGLETPE